MKFRLIPAAVNIATRGTSNESPGQRTPVSNTKTLRAAANGSNLWVLNVRRGSAMLLIPIR